MTLETENFIISDVEYKYAESKEICADRMCPAPQAVGLKALNAACKKCGKTARVSADGRGLSPFIGGAIVTCLFCGNEEKFMGKQLYTGA